ncbi:MAG TPA: hypothetical protein VH988_28945 [Thermoanaerobaculia bacterium]|jgi:hypothetical protein|nr:hypothetical protein [Thermoanaerobaculia bacterium]
MRWPKAEVAVTMRSQSAARSPATREVITRQPGVSARIVRSRASSRSGSIETSTTSWQALARSRAQTEPMAPVAPITMARPFLRPFGPVRPIRMSACLADSSVAATVRLLPLVTAMSASFATVTPASPTTFVKAPRPRMRAPFRSAIRAT